MIGPTLRSPPMIQFCGWMSLAMGLAFAAFSDRVPGLHWYAIPIALLGFVLIVISRRANREAARTPPGE